MNDQEKNQLVEAALLRRALGYEVTEERTEDSEKGMKTVAATKHVPGDISAMGLWLKNRCPERWRDHPEPPADTGVPAAHRALVEAILGKGADGP